MHHPRRVRGRQPVPRLQIHRQHLPPAPRPRRQPGPQRRPADEFHGDEDLVVVLPDLVRSAAKLANLARASACPRSMRASSAAIPGQRCPASTASPRVITCMDRELRAGVA